MPGLLGAGRGVDLSAVGTRIEVTDSHFNVTGQKVWSSFAHIADHCILIGRSDRFRVARGPPSI